MSNSQIPQQIQRQWFNSKQIAERFNISLTTVARWEKKGFPVHRQGYVKRYDPTECDEWLSNLRSGQ